MEYWNAAVIESLHEVRQPVAVQIDDPHPTVKPRVRIEVPPQQGCWQLESDAAPPASESVAIRCCQEIRDIHPAYRCDKVAESVLVQIDQYRCPIIRSIEECGGSRRREEATARCGLLPH